MPRRRSQLDRLKTIAARKGGTVTHSKKQGYILAFNDQTFPLGKDSVDALFYLEKLLMEVK